MQPLLALLHYPPEFRACLREVDLGKAGAALRRVGHEMEGPQAD